MLMHVLLPDRRCVAIS